MKDDPQFVKDIFSMFNAPKQKDHKDMSIQECIEDMNRSIRMKANKDTK